MYYGLYDDTEKEEENEKVRSRLGGLDHRTGDACNCIFAGSVYNQYLYLLWTARYVETGNCVNAGEPWTLSLEPNTAWAGILIFLSNV